ncbi:MAG: hypothetical protein PHD25_05030 [Bacteroidales bacterium]|nr:hypothetical protein [Bacteroidales bacterium]
MSKIFLKYWGSIIILLLITSCHRVVIVVDEIPENTPPGEALYFASNLNRWDPGDERYQLEANANGTWQITLPPGFGTIEYKFTRGGWLSVETDICGTDINNRILPITKDDTIHHCIESWHDQFPLKCEGVVLILDVIPENTPPDADIYFVSSMRDWWTYDKNYLMKRNADGFYELRIPKRVGEYIEFKFNRGPWSTVEVDASGNNIKNRQMVIRDQDTLYFQIERWKDRQ